MADTPNNGPNELLGGIELLGNLPTAGGGASFKALSYPKSFPQGQDKIFIEQVAYKRTGLIQVESDIQSYTKIKGSVTLPMPNDISESNSVKWGEDSLSNTAAMLMPSLTQIAKGVATGNLKNTLSGGTELLENVTDPKIVNRINQFVPVKVAAGIIGKAGINVNPESYISRATSSAINQNLELLFNGPTLRQFGFSFKMTPTSTDEAAEIRRILNFFKKGMAPIRSTESEGSFFLGAPNVFKIKFMSSSEMKSIGRIKTCALVACNVNYTPDGFYAAYKDSAAGGSQPIAVTMSLGFTELTPIFSDEYGATGDTDTVGPWDFESYKNPGLPEATTAAAGNERPGFSGPPTPGTQTAAPQPGVVEGRMSNPFGGMND